jgi:phosphoglycerate dehydrogenase-like enzyme
VSISILDDYLGIALQMADWERLGPDAEINVLRSHIGDEDELVDLLVGSDVLVAMRERTPITRSLLQRLPGLRLVVSTGMRNAAIDMEAAAELGVMVCGTGGSGGGSDASPPTGNPTAELTWGLILALARNIPAEDHAVHAGGWQSHLGVGLGGKRLGLLGLGNIGARVARMALAFEMSVVAWSSNLTEHQCQAVGVELVSKEELFATSDVVSVHLVLGERSRGLVGREELRLMKETALLVNTSRGPIVDEGALIAALRDKTIGGAALDVFDREPLPVEHPLRSLSNTVLTPHIGYVTRSSMQAAYEQVVEDIVAFRSGAPVRIMST